MNKYIVHTMMYEAYDNETACAACGRTVGVPYFGVYVFKSTRDPLFKESDGDDVKYRYYCIDCCPDNQAAKRFGDAMLVMIELTGGDLCSSVV